MILQLITKKNLKSQSFIEDAFWFLLKTFLFYFVLDYFFIVHTGLTIPGGN